jgi:hypothetical protein
LEGVVLRDWLRLGEFWTLEVEDYIQEKGAERMFGIRNYAVMAWAALYFGKY